ncbi:MAG: 50S ribosomal protein L39e [Candidatus Micrarchaeia archaeon]|jgi:large subunit ribosomal protein L39e
MGKKTLTKKMRLVKAERQNKRLPVFITIRTKRKVQSNNQRRNWRTEKLRISE